MFNIKSELQRNNGTSNWSVKRAFIIFLSILLFVFFLILVYKTALKVDDINNHTFMQKGDSIKLNTNNWSQGLTYPSCTGDNEVIHHRFFTLSYSEKNEQAEWVAYELTRDHLNATKHHRINYYIPDPAIPSGSATHFDYIGSGYDRGHLVPAADMSFDGTALEESFLLSNISPQDHFFNSGIWHELEENVRDWARKYQHIYIVTGPILNEYGMKKIGKHKVSVPGLFYKVILHLDTTQSQGIGFIIPNASSESPLTQYMVTIDSVESMTGLDFYNSKSSSIQIEAIENKYNASAWPISDARYKKRVEEWNKKEMSR